MRSGPVSFRWFVRNYDISTSYEHENLLPRYTGTRFNSEMEPGKKKLNSKNSGVNGGINRERIRKKIAKFHNVADTIVVLHDELPESLGKSPRQFRAIAAGSTRQNSAYHFGSFDALNDSVLTNKKLEDRTGNDIWYSLVNSIGAGNAAYNRGLSEIRSAAVKSEKYK